MFFRSSVFDDFPRILRGLERVSSEAALPSVRSALSGGRYPAVESFTKDGQLLVRAEVPGIERDDIEVTVEDGRLILRGEKKAEPEHEETDFHVREVRYGRFERSFILPEDVRGDEVKARMSDGVLEISIPLAEPDSGRKIDIEVGSGSERTEKAA